MGMSVPLSTRTEERFTSEEPPVFVDRETRLSPVNDGYKQIFDLTVIVVFHIILAPVFLILWALIPLAIKMEDGGAVFFRQRRVGKGGRQFTTIKFRTMTETASREYPAMKDDPRITRVGRWLRDLHLDEMPQVLNVIRGEMSLVGPRPLPFSVMQHCLREAPGSLRRLRVLPGITGLAQIRGHYNIGSKDRMHYDDLYMERMSPSLDVRILLISPFSVVVRVWNSKC